MKSNLNLNPMERLTLGNRLARIQRQTLQSFPFHDLLVSGSGSASVSASGSGSGSQQSTSTSTSTSSQSQSQYRRPKNVIFVFPGAGGPDDYTRELEAALIDKYKYNHNLNDNDDGDGDDDDGDDDGNTYLRSYQTYSECCHP